MPELCWFGELCRRVIICYKTLKAECLGCDDDDELGDKVTEEEPETEID